MPRLTLYSQPVSIPLRYGVILDLSSRLISPEVPEAKRKRLKRPFTFVSEVKGGTAPKVTVRDARGTEWIAKFGEEVKPENFALSHRVGCRIFRFADVFRCRRTDSGGYRTRTSGLCD